MHTTSRRRLHIAVNTALNGLSVARESRKRWRNVPPKLLPRADSKTLHSRRSMRRPDCRKPQLLQPLSVPSSRSLGRLAPYWEAFLRREYLLNGSRRRPPRTSHGRENAPPLLALLGKLNKLERESPGQHQALTRNRGRPCLQRRRQARGLLYSCSATVEEAYRRPCEGTRDREWAIERKGAPAAGL